MELVGGLFYTSRSPSYGSTSSAPIDRAGWVSDKDYTTYPCITYFSTTSAHARGYFYYSPCDSYCSTSWSYYIRAFHHHLGFGVSCPCAYLSNTDHHTCYSLPAYGWDASPSGPTDCYTPPDSAAPGTFASTSASPSCIIRAFSSSWGYYSNWGHYHSRGPNPAILGGHHRCHCFIWSSR